MKKQTIQRYLALATMATMIEQTENKGRGLCLSYYSSPIVAPPKYKLKPGQKIWGLFLEQIEYNGPAVIIDKFIINNLDIGIYVIAATKKAAQKKLNKLK